MTTVYFIRHAEPNYANRDEFSRELTPKGIAQSERLLDVFRGIDIDVFFSSPYKRAVDTIKYYQADFGYQDFNANKHKFPWIMAFEFDGIMLKHYHEIHMDDTP